MNPIQNDKNTITIDKSRVDSLSKKIVGAVRSFLVTLIGQPTWDRVGLEKYWRPLFAFAFVVACYLAQYFLMWMAGAVIVITCIWIIRRLNKKGSL